MTTGRQLREQGRRHGRREGFQEALQETLQKAFQEAFREGAYETLLRLLQQRFGAAVDAVIEQRVIEASIEQIETWADRASSVATLGELFARDD